MALKDDEKKRLDLRSKLILDAEKDLAGYLELKKQIQVIDGSIYDLTKEQQKLNTANLKLAEKITKEKAKEGKADLKKIWALEAEQRLNEGAIDDAIELQKQQEESLKTHKSALSIIKKRVVAAKALVNTGKALGKLLIEQKGYLLEQQKAVKETELSMGVLSSQAGAFRNNIYKTSLTTTNLGIDTKSLAKIQGTYSEEVGRAMVMNEEGLTAVAELAKGTILGAEGAAELAANMENFGISAEGSAKLVEDILNTSHKMGVNGSKVVKSIQKNMKLANKYHFQGGIKGLAKMAALTTKFKMEMESVAGFAEKLITPEGAVEAAAKLQVLGGKWAKLGDPFELMFRSRNDIQGLTQDIIEAASGTARWDEVNKEFKIDPMELHRLREVANVTGQSVEELAQMAKEQAKFNKIRSEVRGNFSEDNMEFIETMGKFNDKTGKFEIVIQEDGKTITQSVDSLYKIGNARLDAIRLEEASLKDRAIQSQTFDDRLDNLINTFKSTLLPGFEAFANSLELAFTDIRKLLEDENVLQTFVETGRWIGEKLAWIVKTIVNHPWESLAVVIAGKLAIWFTRGMSLGAGFNSVTKGSGMFGGKGMVKGGGMKGFGRNIGKGAKSFGAIGGGVLAAGFAGLNEWNTNSNTDMSTGENVMRTGAKATGAGVGTWGGAAIGAAIGTAILPGIGTIIGGLIGGAGGGAGGAYLGDKAGDALGSEKYNDFISRPGSNPVSFSSKDTLVGAKKGGPIDKMLNSNIKGGSNGGKVSIEFTKPLMIEGTLELRSGNQSANIDLNDPILMRELSRVVQEQISKAVGGGRTASGPSAVPN